MSLAAGSRLGPYEVLGQIGAGGMGEVYKARDTRLDRFVAIKVLPPAFAADPARRARFEREAKTVAGLSHPHICALHDIGAHDGTTYLVMEYLAGESLADRLLKGPLPLAQALDVAAQIAEALDVAHKHGIIHRDVKPGNVMLTQSGAKLLDFGLAKLAAHGERPAVATDASVPTQTLPVTARGHVVGTLQYMAPEQLEGKHADARSDIWALGATCYEMLAGRPAFAGDTEVSLIGNIMHAEPVPLSTLQPLTPLSIDRLVRRCLAKNPDDRWASAHEAGEELRRITRGDGASNAENGRRPRRRWGRRLAWGTALLGGVGLVLLAGTRGRVVSRPPEASPAASPAASSATGAPARRVVAVALFANRTGDPGLDDVGLMAADWTTDGLTEIATADVALPPSSALGAGSANQAARASYTDPRQVGEATQAAIVVSGEYLLEGEDIVFRTRVSEPTTGRVLATIAPAKGPKGQPVSVAENVRRAAVAAVAYHLDTNFELRSVRVPSLAAYREVAQAMRWWYRDWNQVIQHLERALAADPEYLEAQLLLAAALMYTGNPERGERVLDAAEGRDRGLTEYERQRIRLQRAFLLGRREEHLAAAMEMIRLAPGVNSQGIFPPFEAACMLLFLNRPHEAATLIASVSTRPVYTWVFPEIRLHALHLAGRFDEQYALASPACNMHPGILYFREHQAAALAAKGNIAGVDRVVGEALVTQAESGTPGLVMLVAAMELRAHGHRPEADALAARAAAWYAGQPVERFAALQTPNRGVEWYLNRPPDIRRRLREEHAMALELTGRWDDVQAIVAQLRAADPSSIDYLGWHGVLAARRGDRDEAREVAERLQTSTRQYLYGSNTYWRACIAAQLGEKQAAVDLLYQAVSEGRGYQTQLHRTIDLEPLWGYPAFTEFLRPKG